MALDPQAVIDDGPFQGLTVQQLMDHATAVQSAAANGNEPPPAPKPPKDPAATLRSDAEGRVDQATMLTWSRLEADDETAFAASLPAGEYDKHRKAINEIKDKMPPAMRIARGIHENLYHNVLLKDPVNVARLRGIAPPAAPEGEVEAPIVPPAAPVVPPAAPVPPMAPKPVAPPTAQPTPSGRTPPPAERKPVLKSSEKIVHAARAAGMTIDTYLMQLEDRGVTQDQLDGGSTPRVQSQQNGSAAYGRKRATSR